MFHTFDHNNWVSKSSELARQYREAEPFPHIRLAPFLFSAAAERLVEEFPRTDDPIWKHYNHVNCHKLATNDLEQFPQTAAQVIEELSSLEFVSWLSELVGIPDLVPDPTLEGAGLHQISSGGYLNIHADFTYHHHDSRLRRRVNLLLYLNKEWEDDRCGELELWDADMKNCVAKYPPLINEAIIFSTSESSWHGHPRPLNSPGDIGRKSIALYYYTKENEPGDQMRATQFQALPSDAMGARFMMWLDQKALNIYTRVKQSFGIQNDNHVTKVLGSISLVFSGRSKPK